MNRLQKLAWFNLKVVAVGGSVSLLTIAISLAAGEVVISYLGFLILAVSALIMALSPLLLRKEPGRVTFDERDATIEKKAHLIGYCLLWCIFIVICLIAIPIAGFAILATALVTVQLIESVATLAQYSWWNKDGEE